MNVIHAEKFMDTEAIFKALANPVRRQILQWLKHPEQNFPDQFHSFDYGVCAKQIEMKSNLSQSTMSNHLSVLQQADLVVVQKHGQWSFFSRNEALIRQYLQFLQDTL